jgi:serine phosphatase RsbU (regulator of sigma subunit)
MSLRTRLIIAFLLLSVVPLTAVTLLSYTSSVRAFERAAEREASEMAADVSHRMDLVTADLGRRMGRLTVAGPADGEMDQAHVRQQIAPLLGDAAALVERFEFRPLSAGTAGGGAGVPVPAPPPTPGAPPRPPASVIVMDIPKLVEDARKVGMEGLAAAAGPDAARQFDAEMRKGIDEARLQAMAARATREAAARATEARVPTERVPTENEGQQVAVAVRRDGQVLGHAHATLNMERTLQTVLGAARRHAEEVHFAVDRRGTIHTPNPDDVPRLEAMGVVRASEDDGVAVQRAGDWIVASRRAPAGMTFGIARPIAEPLREIRRTSLRNLGLGLLVVVLALAAIVPLATGMTRHATTLTEGVRRLAGGDFATRVPVRSSDEFGVLAAAFNQMAADLERHEAMAVEQERMRRELELSRLIQTEMLPHGPLVAGAAEIAGLSLPAREVGGDFFNYFILPDTRLAMLVGDVSGKGVSAALLMANVQATLRARMPYEPDLAKLADTLDRELDLNTPGAVYLTLFVGLLEPGGRVLRYVNAGHNPQFLLRGTGRIEPLSSTGLPIAIYAGHGYHEARVEVEPGDLLFFYTDGLVETENEQGEMFSAERLQALLAGADGDVNSVLRRIAEALDAHRGHAEPFDDATLMAMRIVGSRQQ